MKAEDYYADMRTVDGCVAWAKSTGLKFLRNKPYIDITLPRGEEYEECEIDITIIFNYRKQEAEFINFTNRLRQWKES